MLRDNVALILFLVVWECVGAETVLVTEETSYNYTYVPAFVVFLLFVVVIVVCLTNIPFYSYEPVPSCPPRSTVQACGNVPVTKVTHELHVPTFSAITQNCQNGIEQMQKVITHTTWHAPSQSAPQCNNV